MEEKRKTLLTQEDMCRSPGYLVRRLHQLSTAAFVSETQGCDLTPIQFSALLVIASNPGTDAARVSDVIAFDRTTVGEVLGRLEDKGLIRREPGREDRRRKILRITPAGEAVTARACAAIANVEQRIIGGLALDEQRTFLALLEKTIATMQAGEFADAAE